MHIHLRPLLAVGIPILILLTLPAAAQTSVQIRICTWNILNFPGTTLPIRTPHIGAIIESIKPDILATQEMGNFTAATTLQVILLNSRLIAAPLIDGPDTDNGLLYDSSKMDLSKRREVIGTP